MLKDLTIVAIDSLNYQATTMALDKTRAIFPDAEVIVLSDKNFYGYGRWYETPKFNTIDHSRICLEEVADKVNTNWALFIQYDGFPTNPEFWTDEFLKYDYIGSPYSIDGVPLVGNGGFSLRSKKLLDLSTQLKQSFETIYDWLEDQLISVKFRPWLESQGIKYPSVELAGQFSKTDPQGPGATFGFHGQNLIPCYTDKEFTKEWLNAIDDSIFYSKNLYCIPYYLWQWEEFDLLREFFIKANRINFGWTDKCWAECRWRIPQAHPEVDLFELQKMITIYGYVD